MSSFDPRKLHVTFEGGVPAGALVIPRRYTLTHSDVTGDLFLTIGAEYDRAQIAGLYTRLMRDEVLAEWKNYGDQAALHVYVHVSGGIAFGFAGWRNAILHYHMPMVLEAFRYGDREIYSRHPELDEAEVLVHFVSHRKRYNREEDWEQMGKYKTAEHSG
jgi:hypothetical protein